MTKDLGLDRRCINGSPIPMIHSLCVRSRQFPDTNKRPIPNSVQYQKVMRINGGSEESGRTDGLKDFRRVGDDQQKTADIRIYCDNDARWKLRQDQPVSMGAEVNPITITTLTNDAFKNLQQNSKIAEEQQEWWDEVNLMTTRGKPSCYQPSFIAWKTQAATYVEAMQAHDDGSAITDQNPQRATITVSKLCNGTVRS